MPRVLEARAVIFDLDGVLADSTHAVNASWGVWAKRHGIDPVVAIENGHGRPSIEAIRVTAPHLDANTEFAEMEALEESFGASVVAVTGAREFVEGVIALGIPWAVATSGTRRIAVPRLEKAGIPPPPAIVTADDITHGKPHPEPYEKAAAALGIKPWQCVVFEDAPSGILSARRAGAAVIAIGPEWLRHADDSAVDFLDVRVERADEAFTVTTAPSHFQCDCCACHTLLRMQDECRLCRWSTDAGYELEEARENTRAYGVMFRPADPRFAPSRHPILGPKGEYAIDRVALRERAYVEFRAFAQSKNSRAQLPARLAALLECIANADRLYNK